MYGGHVPGTVGMRRSSEDERQHQRENQRREGTAGRGGRQGKAREWKKCGSGRCTATWWGACGTSVRVRGLIVS